MWEFVAQNTGAFVTVSIIPAVFILASSLIRLLVLWRQHVTHLTFKRGDVEIRLDSAKPEDAEQIVRYYLTVRDSGELAWRESKELESRE